MRKRFFGLPRLVGRLFLAAAILISASCKSPLDVPPVGYVTVDFSAGEGASRAAGALPADIKSIVISVKADDMDAIAKTLTAPALTATLDVPAGAARQFEVVASNADAIPLYQGKQALDIEAGAEHALSVTMRSLYKLSYDGNGAVSGSVPDALYRATGDAVTVAPNSGLLAKTGFTFGGWNTAVDGSGTQYAAGENLIMPIGDIALYAKWNPLSSAKDITAFGFTVPAVTGVITGTNIAVTVPFGTNVTSLSPVVTHTGTGISPALDSAIDFSAAVTFIVAAADSTTKTYTVTVTVAPSSNANLAVGGLVVSGVSLTPGFSPAIVTYTASVNSTIPSVTVTPTKADAGGSIQVQINGGGYSLETSGSPTGALPLNPGPNTIEVLVTAADSTTKAYTVTVTKRVSVTINYTAGGTGTPTGMLEYVPGEVVSLDIIPNAGYAFSGWTGDISNIAAPALVSTVWTIPNSNATINANFTPNSYDVIFNTNGGSGIMSPQSIQFNNTLPLSFNVFSNPGFMFAGWATSPTGPIIYPDGASFTMNVLGQTLYAQWTAIVIYDSNAADVDASPSSHTVFAHTPVVGVLPTPPVKAGYTFAGWSTALNDGLEFVATTPVTGNVTVYAMWSTAGLEYTLINANTEYSVAKGTADTSGIVSIPYYWMGKKVTMIASSAFSNCVTMTGIVIPSGVTIISDQAFYHCDALASVTIPPNVTTLYAAAFQYCGSLTSVVIPAGVTTIGNQVFAYNSNLTSVTIPGTVISMGDWVFGYCTSLTSLTLPSNLTTIGASAFRGMNTLSNLTIPATVTSIGDSAFSECTVLNLLTINPIAPPTAGVDLFLSSLAIGANSLLVPAGSVSAYQAAPGWSSYSSFIGSQ